MKPNYDWLENKDEHYHHFNWIYVVDDKKMALVVPGKRREVKLVTE